MVDNSEFRIRPALESDARVILRMIKALADHEGLSHEFAVTEAVLRQTLFGPRPAAEVVLGYSGTEPVGFAVFFPTFSTAPGHTGLFLEDLYVEPEWRGRGFGRKLLAHVANVAAARGGGTVTWSVLRRNERAMRFYRSLGAEPVEDSLGFRLVGEALRRLAGEEASASHEAAPAKEARMDELTLLEGIRTLRAIREFTDEPVSNEQIAAMLDLAVCAPSGGNRQPWHFVVIRDPATRRTIRDYYVDVFRGYRQSVLRQASEGHPAAQAQVARWERGGAPDAFAENLDRAPVLILVCLDRLQLGFAGADPAGPLPPTAWASIYPAVQNLLLAAHGLGLGAVLTTLHMPHEPEIKALLGIPAHVHTAALVPVGHPKRKPGPPRRIPASERTHRERWDGR